MGEYDNEELSRIVAELNRAAPSQKSSSFSASRIPQSTASLDKLLSTAATRNASDVVIVVGAPAVYRISGALSLASGPPFDAEDIRSLLLPLLEPELLPLLEPLLDPELLPLLEPPPVPVIAAPFGVPPPVGPS